MGNSKIIQTWSEKVIGNIGKVILGKEAVIEKILAALLCGGHVLLEDVPGVGKTILARALSKSCGVDMKRIQCTPDLLPADVLGVSIYNQKEGRFVFKEGPVMTQLLLVDEINRSTPRTQSALLEAMENRTISVDGIVRELPDPFFLIATENPIEFEGTFPLPAAQKDRFFMALTVGYPEKPAELEILSMQNTIRHPVEMLTSVTDAEEIKSLKNELRNIAVNAACQDLILDIVEATRTNDYFSVGASPRASRALYDGSRALAALRGMESPDLDIILELAPAVIWKRISLKPEYVFREMRDIDILNDIVRSARKKYA